MSEEVALPPAQSRFHFQRKSSLPISQQTALFSLLGTTFGGDGQTTFALPDLRGKAPIDGLAYYIAINGIYPPRQ